MTTIKELLSMIISINIKVFFQILHIIFAETVFLLHINMKSKYKILLNY